MRLTWQLVGQKSRPHSGWGSRGACLKGGLILLFSSAANWERSGAWGCDLGSWEFWHTSSTHFILA